MSALKDYRLKARINLENKQLAERLQKHETKITKANKKLEEESDKYNEKVKSMRDKVYRKHVKSDYDAVLAAYTDLKEKIARDEEDINGMKRRISKLVVYINKYEKALGSAAPAGDDVVNEAEETDVSPADEEIENTNEDTNIVIDETVPTGDEELDSLLVEYNLLQSKRRSIVAEIRSNLNKYHQNKEHTAKMKKNNEIYSFWIKRYDAGSGRNPQDIVVTEAMQKEIANLFSSTTATNDVALKAPSKEKVVAGGGASNNDSDKMSSKLQQLKLLLFENELIELIRQEELHLGPLSDSINENQAIHDTIQKQIREIVNEINKQKEIQDILQDKLQYYLENRVASKIRDNITFIQSKLIRIRRNEKIKKMETAIDAVELEILKHKFAAMDAEDSGGLYHK